MKKYFVILSFILFLGMSYSCKYCSITSSSPETSSHNFNWEIIEFGDFASSMIYDVHINNENDIWAVGYIYTYDSLGQKDISHYNKVKWNGEKWKISRIELDFPGYSSVNPEIKDIQFLPDGNIIFIDGYPILPTDDGYTAYQLHFMSVLDNDDGTINRCWGTSLDNLYFVGNKGTIVHYDGNSWQRMESGTELSFNDIYGAYNLKKQKWDIIAIASTRDSSNGNAVFKIDGNTVEPINRTGLEYHLRSLWFMPNQECFITGTDIFSNPDINNKDWKKVTNDKISQYSSNGIDGNDINDIIVVGNHFEVLHYNGETWHNYNDEIPCISGSLVNVDIKEDLVVAGGYSGNKAIIIIGRR